MKLKQSKIKLLWLLAGWQKDYATMAPALGRSCQVPGLAARISTHIHL